MAPPNPSQPNSEPDRDWGPSAEVMQEYRRLLNVARDASRSDDDAAYNRAREELYAFMLANGLGEEGDGGAD